MVRQAHRTHGSVAGRLHRVATCKAIDILRKDKRQEETSATLESQPVGGSPDWQQLSVRIDEAMDQLDTVSRQLLIEHYLEGRSTREVAQQHGVSQATVSRKLNAALKLLRNRLGAPGLVITSAVMESILGESSAQAAPATLIRTLRKIGMAGHGLHLGVVGKAVYWAGSLPFQNEPPLPAVAAADTTALPSTAPKPDLPAPGRAPYPGDAS
jgi:transposase-like protein